jgi:hypothetical protein
MTIALGLVVLLLPTIYLGLTYLPRGRNSATPLNPGITFGSAIGLVLLGLYVFSILSTSGFEHLPSRRRFQNVYLWPSIAFALVIFPRYAAKFHPNYASIVEFDASGLLRLIGYAFLLYSTIYVFR